MKKYASFPRAGVILGLFTDSEAAWDPNTAAAPWPKLGRATLYCTGHPVGTGEEMAFRMPIRLWKILPRLVLVFGDQRKLRLFVPLADFPYDDPRVRTEAAYDYLRSQDAVGRP